MFEDPDLEMYNKMQPSTRAACSHDVFECHRLKGPLRRHRPLDARRTCRSRRTSKPRIRDHLSSLISRPAHLEGPTERLTAAPGLMSGDSARPFCSFQFQSLALDVAPSLAFHLLACTHVRKLKMRLRERGGTDLKCKEICPHMRRAKRKELHS